jgi:hypothetical protein
VVSRENDNTRSSGILVTRGVTPSFPPGALSITLRDDGTHKMEARLHLHYDVCPTWLELSLRHLVTAEEQHNAVLTAWKEHNRQAAAAALDSEFQAGMQAAISGCISLDAFYANLKELITLPEDIRKQWAKRKTSRPARVAELFRRCFSMKSATATRVRDVLKQIYGFRDLTVHPSGKTEEAVLHPDLEVGVEWRFIAFGFPNVKEVVAGCLGMAAQLANKPKGTHKQLIQYCEGVRTRIDPIVEQWEERYGELYPKSNNKGSQADLNRMTSL